MKSRRDSSAESQEHIIGGDEAPESKTSHPDKDGGILVTTDMNISEEISSDHPPGHR